MTLKNVRYEMEKLLYDNSYRSKMINEYQRLEKVMGEPGCSERAAKKMIALLEGKTKVVQTSNFELKTLNSV